MASLVKVLSGMDEDVIPIHNVLAMKCMSRLVREAWIRSGSELHLREFVRTQIPKQSRPDRFITFRKGMRVEPRMLTTGELYVYGIYLQQTKAFSFIKKLVNTKWSDPGASAMFCDSDACFPPSVDDDCMEQVKTKILPPSQRNKAKTASDIMKIFYFVPLLRNGYKIWSDILVDCSGITEQMNQLSIDSSEALTKRKFGADPASDLELFTRCKKICENSLDVLLMRPPSSGHSDNDYNSIVSTDTVLADDVPIDQDFASLLTFDVKDEIQICLYFAMYHPEDMLQVLDLYDAADAKDNDIKKLWGSRQTDMAPIMEKFRGQSLEVAINPALVFASFNKYLLSVDNPKSSNFHDAVQQMCAFGIFFGSDDPDLQQLYVKELWIRLVARIEGLKEFAPVQTGKKQKVEIKEPPKKFEQKEVEIVSSRVRAKPYGFFTEQEMDSASTALVGNFDMSDSRRIEKLSQWIATSESVANGVRSEQEVFSLVYSESPEDVMAVRACPTLQPGTEFLSDGLLARMERQIRRAQSVGLIEPSSIILLRPTGMSAAEMPLDGTSTSDKNAWGKLYTGFQKVGEDARAQRSISRSFMEHIPRNTGSEFATQWGAGVTLPDGTLWSHERKRGVELDIFPMNETMSNNASGIWWGKKKSIPTVRLPIITALVVCPVSSADPLWDTVLSMEPDRKTLGERFLRHINGCLHQTNDFEPTRTQSLKWDDKWKKFIGFLNEKPLFDEFAMELQTPNCPDVPVDPLFIVNKKPADATVATSGHGSTTQWWIRVGSIITIPLPVSLFAAVKTAMNCQNSVDPQSPFIPRLVESLTTTIRFLISQAPGGATDAQYRKLISDIPEFKTGLPLSGWETPTQYSMSDRSPDATSWLQDVEKRIDVVSIKRQPPAAASVSLSLTPSGIARRTTRNLVRNFSLASGEAIREYWDK